MKTIIEMENILNQTDLHYDIIWLDNSQQTVEIKQLYPDDIYAECRYMLNIFCLQEIREIAYAISEDFEHDISTSVGNYLFMLQELEIDIKLFTLLAGEIFFKSDYYEYGDEDDINTQLLTYLITENYYNISQIIIKDYGDNQKLLESIITPYSIYTTYQKALEDIDSVEDCFDYPEIMRLHAWADGGFDISGES